jgi:hypothetical protein
MESELTDVAMATNGTAAAEVRFWSCHNPVIFEAVNV